MALLLTRDALEVLAYPRQLKSHRSLFQLGQVQESPRSVSALLVRATEVQRGIPGEVRQDAALVEGITERTVYVKSGLQRLYQVIRKGIAAVEVDLRLLYQLQQKPRRVLGYLLCPSMILPRLLCLV